MSVPPDQLRPRLEEHRPPHWPFRRADGLTGSGLYWLPVSAFPLRSHEKQWLAALAALFCALFKEKLQLRQENFINFDYIYPHLHQTFLKHSMEFNPIGGILVQPSKPLFRPPGEEELREMLESGDASKLRNAPKSTAYWLAKNKGPKQFDVYFGHGAMIALWLPATGETKPPDFHLPRKALQNPAFKGLNIEAEIEFTYSLRDPFLAASKKTFAPELEGDPQYGGMPFAVPLFTAGDIFNARGEFRDACLHLFGAYMAESRDDKGILFWCSPDCEPLFTEAISVLRGQGVEYPTV